MLIDSHTHLNFKDYSSDFDQVIARLLEAGVKKVVNIGTSMTDAKEVIDLAGKYNWIYAAVGLHPNDDLKITQENIDWEKFEKLVVSPKVVAIGECGLDYSRIKDKGLRTNEGGLEIERQKKLFTKQIELAEKLSLPMSLHIRDAQEDIINEFAEKLQKVSGAFHCFSGDQKYLDFILNTLPNFYVSIAGNITFRNAQQLRDLAKGVPLERLLIETDCPFLTPEPNRGKRNEPANVKITAQKLAEIKNLSFEEISEATTKNAESLFKI